MKQAPIWILGACIFGCAGIAGYYFAHSSPEAPSLQPQSQNVADSQPQPPTISNQYAPVQAMLTNLQSPDPALRQRGKETLAALPDDPDVQGLLQIAAGQMPDPQLKILLTTRLNQMNTLLELTPPVSLHVKDATLLEIVPQLNLGMNARMEANQFADQSRYTLDLDRRPFWEIILALNAQHPLGLNPNTIPSGSGPLGALTGVTPNTASGNGNLSIFDVARTNGIPLMEKALIKGPFLFYARWRPPLPANLQVSPYAVLTMLAADPRLTILDVQQTCGPIADELGHILETPPPAANTFALDYRTAPVNFTFPLTWRLAAPADVGKTISMTVRAKIVIAVSTLEADIDDIAAKLNQPVQLGTTTVTLTSLTNDSQMHLGCSSTATSGKPYVIYDLYDRNGMLLHHWKNAGAATAYVPVGTGGPYRLHLTAPRQTSEFNLEFAIKDWPLPK